MIKQICDLCNRETNMLESIILHTTSFDFCTRCQKEVREIINVDKEIYAEEYKNFKERLKKREKTLINNFVIWKEK